MPSTEAPHLGSPLDEKSKLLCVAGTTHPKAEGRGGRPRRGSEAGEQQGRPWVGTSTREAGPRPGCRCKPQKLET